MIILKLNTKQLCLMLAAYYGHTQHPDDLLPQNRLLLEENFEALGSSIYYGESSVLDSIYGSCP